MTRNQLPEGVGKKIVEALKKQAETDITPISETKNTMSADIPVMDIQGLPEIDSGDISVEETLNDGNTIIEEEQDSILPLGAQNDGSVWSDYDGSIQEAGAGNEKIDNYEIPAEEPVLNIGGQNVQNFSQSVQNAASRVLNSQINNFKQDVPQAQINAADGAINTNIKSNVNIPANVMVLKNLIASLPVGVTKQTGAQIIRQTIEAMGIPMNGVLKEAQEVQEELNSSTRECMLRIQEYKTNILQLEQSVQEYRRTINQINDLVSLFLLTDRK